MGEIGNIRNVALVLFAEENIDMVVLSFSFTY
jgi:hypothetical protein